MTIGWFFFIPSLGDVVAVASQGRFSFFLHPSLGDVVADASQGRFFLFFTSSGTKMSYLVKKVISGPDSLKKHDI